MFENRYTVTKEMYKEYVNKVICRNIYIYSTVVLVLALIETFINLYNKDYSMITLNVLVFVICLFAMILTPKIALSNLMEVDKKLHSGTRPETVVTFNEKIVLTEGEQTIKIDYSQIQSYIRMKNSSVLMFAKQNGIMFVENNFINGNKEEFEKFILEKCNHVREIIER